MLGRGLLVLVLCSIAWVADYAAPALGRATTEGPAWQADSRAGDDADARLIAAHRANATLSDSSPRVAPVHTQGPPIPVTVPTAAPATARFHERHSSPASHLDIPLLI